MAPLGEWTGGSGEAGWQERVSARAALGLLISPAGPRAAVVRKGAGASCTGAARVPQGASSGIPTLLERSALQVIVLKR